MTFINCTLMDNFADAMESEKAAAATVGDRNEYSNTGLAFVHCTLANNTAKGGIASADLLFHPKWSLSTCFDVHLAAVPLPLPHRHSCMT